MTDYTRKAMRGAVVSFLFLGLSSATALLIRIVLARNLSVDDFGLFYAVLAFVGIFTFLRDLGLSEAQVMFIQRFLNRNLLERIKGLVYLVLSVQAAIGTLFFTAFAIAGPALAQHYFKSPVAFDIIVILGLWFLIDGIIETIAMAFNATHNLFYQTSMEFVRLLSVLGIMSILLSCGFGPRAPAFAYVLGALLVSLFYFVLLLAKVFPYFKSRRFSLTTQHIKEYLKYSLPLVPASAISAFLMARVSVLLLTYFKTLHVVGLFTAAISISQVLKLLRTPIRYVLFPMTSELWEKGKKRHLSDGISLVLKYALILGLPAIGVLFAFPVEFLRVLFGQEYVAAAGILRILAFVMLGSVYNNVITTVFMGIGKPLLATRQLYIGGAINFLLGVALIPLFGAYGASIALLIALLGTVTYGGSALKRYVYINIPWKEGFKTFLSCALFISIIFLLKSVLELPPVLEIILCLGGSIPIYVGALFALRVVGFEEIRNLVEHVLSKEEKSQNQ